MMNDNSSSSIVENDDQQLQQLIRNAEEQRCSRYGLELAQERDYRKAMDSPSQQERSIRQLWSEISRVRRNDPTLSIWNFGLPKFYEPNLFRSWCQALDQSKHIKMLDLSSAWIVLDEVAKAVAKGIEQTKAEKLNLRSVVKEDPSMNNWPILYQGLRSNQTIQHLTLDNVPLHYDLGETLLLPQSLKELTLNRVTLTEAGAAALVKGIGQSKVESLAVQFHTIGASLWDLIGLVQHSLGTQGLLHACLVCDALMQTTSLKKLDLHGGTWDEARMADLARGMKHNPSLKTLLLERCSINDDGTASLFFSGENGRVTLEHLTLDGCGVGVVGILWMTMLWPPTSSQRVLTLTNNRIETTGVRLLLDALRDLPSIERLNLGDNKAIGYEGLRMIGEDLLNQPYLTHVSLLNCATWTSHDDADRAQAQATAQHQAGQALLEGVKRNQQIKSLDLDGISFPRKLKHEIQYYVGLNICGRHLLSTQHELATGVWSYILAKCQRQDKQQANLTYFFLQERPDLIPKERFRTPTSAQTMDQAHELRPRKRQRQDQQDLDCYFVFDESMLQNLSTRHGVLSISSASAATFSFDEISI